MRAPRVLLIATVMLAGGCVTDGAYREFDVRFAGTAPAPLAPGADDAALLDTVAWLLANRLGLPFPDTVKGYVYVNEATFVEGLIRNGTREELAWEQGRHAAAVAGRQGISLRGDVVARMALAGRAGLYAHELAHIAQRRMGEGARVPAAVWIREGHADWAKYRVLDLLGYRPYAESKADVQRAVRGSTTPRQFFPSLGELESNAAWIAARNRLGSEATYGQAFLAVDWLIERHSGEALHEFLRRIGRESGVWGSVFAMSYAEFIEEFRARLQRLE